MMFWVGLMLGFVLGVGVMCFMRMADVEISIETEKETEKEES